MAANDGEDLLCDRHDVDVVALALQEPEHARELFISAQPRQLQEGVVQLEREQLVYLDVHPLQNYLRDPIHTRGSILQENHALHHELVCEVSCADVHLDGARRLVHLHVREERFK